MPTALIIGPGYLGRRVGENWLREGYTVYALTRSNGAELQGLGFEPIVGDVLEPATLVQFPPVDRLLYAVGLDRKSGRSMREVYVNGAANVFNAVRVNGPIVYISSTSVYGQTAGEWVAESSATIPTDGSGQVVLDAEETILAIRPETIRLRFAGIYGPNRILRKEALLKGSPLVGDADKWLNLIHVEDGANAVSQAANLATPGSVYNIADTQPVRRREFYTYSAECLGAPAATFEPGPMEQSFSIDANRRIDSSKARAELDWTLKYPSFREGLPAAIRES